MHRGCEVSLLSSRFTKINEAFVCANCGFEVPPSGGTCRDHCPRCLYSLHVDQNPGDRAADCGGMLKPMGYEARPKKGYMILYVCEKCGMKRTTRFLETDKILPDSVEALLALTPKF